MYKKLFYSKKVQTIANLIYELAKTCWDLKLSDSSGFSISQKISDDLIITDKTGTGFRRNRISPEDLILIDLDANFIFSPDKKDTRKAPTNVIVHIEGYKKCSAQACIHWHDPFINAFSCLAKSIEPFTLQSKLIGSVPCVVVDDRKEKRKLQDENFMIPSGLHQRRDVFFVMKKVGEKTGILLEKRQEELKSHGIVLTHFEHGLFSFGRNLEESFDNGYRAVRNAQTIIYSKILKGQ